MKDLIKKQREETADTITDHFFRRGAVVSKKDYLYVLDLLQESQTELIQAVIEELSPYCEHTRSCILFYFGGGRPTANGGYEQEFDGKWYQTNPIDETPKCDCGLNYIYSKLKDLTK